MVSKELSIVIVSFNTAACLGSCLDSIAAESAPVREVFVVDNASADGSGDLVKRKYPWVQLIENKVNRGFGPANNQALSLCGGKYILFLNPDTTVLPGALEKFIVYMDTHARVGLAGSTVINPDGSLQESVSRRYPGERQTRRELSGLRGSIACVLGASMIARTEIVRGLKGFDEDFFLYGEDQDLCLRVRKVGYEVGYCKEAVVVHHGGQSERDSTSFELWRKKARAEYLFYRKHYAPETISRIRRNHLAKALWRIATLTLFLPLAADRKKTLEKLMKYRAFYLESKNSPLARKGI